MLVSVKMIEMPIRSKKVGFVMNQRNSKTVFNDRNIKGAVLGRLLTKSVIDYKLHDKN